MPPRAQGCAGPGAGAQAQAWVRGHGCAGAGGHVRVCAYVRTCVCAWACARTCARASGRGSIFLESQRPSVHAGPVQTGPVMWAISMPPAGHIGPF